MNRSILASMVLALMLSASCKKKPVTVIPLVKDPDTTTVAETKFSRLYGYTADVRKMYDEQVTCTFGRIDPEKSTISSLSVFVSSVIENKAAFNTTDNCYYTFKGRTGSAGMMSGRTPLFKITTAGGVDTFYSSSKDVYTGLTYNKMTDKLYCWKRTTGNGSIVEVTTAADTFATKEVATALYPFAKAFTVDNTKGYIYYVTIDTPSSIFHIERYEPGKAVPKSVATGSDNSLQSSPRDLCFNSNDGMLYGTRKTGSAGFDFIQIDPSTGVIKFLSHFAMNFSPFFFSSCIDPVSNRYIFSQMLTGWSQYPAICILSQLNMKGEVLKQDTTATFFHGLIAK